MAIRAKFTCDFTTDFGDRILAQLHPVTGSNGENADYAKFTPAGQMSITIDKGTAAEGFFKPKQSYYLTIEDAAPVLEPADPGDHIIDGHESAVR